MESRLVFDNRDKQLCLEGKTTFLHSSNVALKLRNILNLSTADFQIHGSLTKLFSFGTMKDPLYDERLRFGMGVALSSARPDTLLCLHAKKKVRVSKKYKVSKGKDIVAQCTDATLKGMYNYDLNSDTWFGTLHASLSHTMLKFHENMDVRLTAGVRFPFSKRGMLTQSANPYLKIEENCWCVETNLGTFDRWVVSYHL